MPAIAPGTSRTPWECDASSSESARTAISSFCQDLTSETWTAVSPATYQNAARRWAKASSSSTPLVYEVRGTKYDRRGQKSEGNWAAAGAWLSQAPSGLCRGLARARPLGHDYDEPRLAGATVNLPSRTWPPCGGWRKP